MILNAKGHLTPSLREEDPCFPFRSAAYFRYERLPGVYDPVEQSLGIDSIIVKTISDLIFWDRSASDKPSRIHLPSEQDNTADRRISIINEALLPSRLLASDKVG